MYHQIISELQGCCEAVSNLVSQTLYSEVHGTEVINPFHSDGFSPYILIQ